MNKQGTARTNNAPTYTKMNQTWINILQQNHKLTKDEQRLTNESSNKSKHIPKRNKHWTKDESKNVQPWTNILQQTQTKTKKMPKHSNS